MASEPQNLRGAAANGALWVALSQSVRVAAQFVSVILLSRLLSPLDFGVTASVSPIITFMVIFQDLGLQGAIVQRAEISQSDLNDSFWVTVLLGVVLAITTVLLSPVETWFFHDPRLLAVTAVSGLPLIVYALSSVPAALLQRHERFGLLARIDITITLVTLVVAAAGALLGARYWSLIFGTIAGSLTNTAVCAWSAGWRPNRPSWKWPDKSLLSFGANMTGFTLVNFFARNADNMIIGHAAGPIELGYYDRAYKLLLLPLQNIIWPLSRVMLPLLSRIEADKPRLRSVYLRATMQLAVAIVPGMAALVAAAGPTVALLFGAKWAGVTPIFLWLGLAGLIQPISGTSGWIFMSQAKTHDMFRLGLYHSIITIIAFLVGIHWGAVGVAAAYCLAEYLLKLPLQYWWMGQIGPVTARDLIAIQAPLLVAATITIVLTHRVLESMWGLHGIALIVVAGVLSYLCAIIIMAFTQTGRHAFGDAIRTVRHALDKRAGVLQPAPPKL